MGRHKTVDRNNLLDLAEEIVRTQGAAALTIDSLAKAAGITKGGVQYTFPSKVAMIEALCSRWMESYETLFAKLIAPDPSPVDVIHAHVGATFTDNSHAQAKAASMMTGMLQSPEFISATQNWYRRRMHALDPSAPEDRRARLAFLATEGAFFLRYFGFLDMTDEEWTAIFRDIRSNFTTERQAPEDN
ncbi:TetR/AcrR family transcriptional regulator [Pseudotabrizicola sp. 4114]|uniref:TetR/AcrR family transcriptional regulator n=1 Tax=Pseudotabrizicola sp. 4114 TaxID=2817731 RepID=UPI00286579E9|nr:AcrR family transcriptional regulator [Pseudorhodobacter sp. 4114]